MRLESSKEDARISGTKVLQNLTLVVVKYWGTWSADGVAVAAARGVAARGVAARGVAARGVAVAAALSVERRSREDGVAVAAALSVGLPSIEG